MVRLYLTFLGLQYTIVHCIHLQSGSTALHVASLRFHSEVIKVLRYYHADVYTQNQVLHTETPAELVSGWVGVICTQRHPALAELVSEWVGVICTQRHPALAELVSE